MRRGCAGHAGDVTILPLVERLTGDGSGLAVPQPILGNPHPPWRPIGERDVAHVMDEIAMRDPRLIALSRHDSTPWTYDAFSRRFGDRYRTLRAGEQLTISAAAAGPPTPPHADI